MEITLATPDRLAAIHAVYEDARAIQREQDSAVWPPFPDAAVLNEIDQRALYCVFDGPVLAGVFSLIESDALLWGDDERGEHLYLHRIARSQLYRRRGFIDAVIEFSFQECRARRRAGVRMDTWGSNHALVSLYEKRGFRLVDSRRMPADPRLSPHYHGIVLALLEAPCSAEAHPANTSTLRS